MSAATSDDRPQPRSLTDLFFSFTLLALQGFGGVLAIVQREFVEKKRWLTPDEFIDDWAVAQVMPGPNVINLALMIGSRYFGLRGAFVALAGMIVFPLMLVLLLALIYAQFSHLEAVAGALRGMGAVAAGLVTATGLRLLPAFKKHPLGIRMCSLLGGLTFVMVALLRWPLPYVLFGLGAIACALTYKRVRP